MLELAVRQAKRLQDPPYGALSRVSCEVHKLPQTIS